ncbi:MAG: hypothetical protein K2X47_03575 [Bdellovibrionales bacterium]|nr:hypothetical protein [Bdellovibrionales bacterium]
MNYSRFIFILLCAISGTTFAKPNPAARYIFQFGPEFTVSSRPLLQTYVDAGGGQDHVVIQTPESIQMLEDYGKILKEQLVRSAKSPWRYSKIHDGSWGRNKLHFTDSQDFRIVVLSDPGVIEINHSPITVKNAIRKERSLQKLIFENFKTLGLQPMEYAGSGHIHMDLNGFRGNLRLFRDFLVDFHNHSGLTLGGLNHDRYNAVGMSEMTETQKDNFRSLVGEVDSGAIESIPQFISELIESVFKDLSYDPLIKRSRADKYYATSFSPSYQRFGTMELRCVRPQASYQTFIHQIQMLEARVNYLAERIQRGEPPIKVGDLQAADAQTALGQFDSYVTEAGLDFANYEPMVLDWWQVPGGELDQYRRRKQKLPSTVKNCSALSTNFKN